MGQKTFKDELKTQIRILKVTAMRKSKGLQTGQINLNSVLIGSPGTGKQTAGLMLGPIHQSLDMLDNNRFIKADSVQLLGVNVETTVLQTVKALEAPGMEALTTFPVGDITALAQSC